MGKYEVLLRKHRITYSKKVVLSQIYFSSLVNDTLVATIVLPYDIPSNAKVSFTDATAIATHTNNKWSLTCKEIQIYGNEILLKLRRIGNGAFPIASDVGYLVQLENIDISF